MGRLAAIAFATLVSFVGGCSERDSEPIDCSSAPVLSLAAVSDEHL